MNIVIVANKRDYTLNANIVESGEQETYIAEFERVTSFGDTRVVSTGETRVIHVSETSNPYILYANKRDYSLNAPLVKVE